MAELYTTGVNRIAYRAEAFAAGKTVTAYLWSPALVKSALQTFTEIELGLYYLDYNFASSGTYLGLFYEGGVAKASGVFRVTEVTATLEARLTAARAGYIDELAAVNIPADLDAVKAAVSDALAELSQGKPTATPTLSQAMMLIYMALRNKLTTKSNELAIYNDAGTKIAKKVLGDDGIIYTETEMESGA